MGGLEVTRVKVAAPVTSFRHPFFVVGVQPSFDIPPPSTIHGHCASALGHWPDPATFFFGVHFTYRSKVRDLEHQHITSALPGRSKTMVPVAGGQVRATTEITVQPVVREMLFGAELTLYLDREVGRAFRAPVYPMILGRSQDLAEVLEVEDVTLEKVVPSVEEAQRRGHSPESSSARRQVRLEHTLLPRSVRPCVRFGATVLLPRYISEPPERNATFAQFILLHEPVFWGGPDDSSRTFDHVEGISLVDFYCDPSFEDDDGFARGVWIHRLVDAS